MSEAPSSLILRATLLSGLGKVAGLALSMLVLALGVSRLGKEVFGQLVTLQAINATSQMFDIGLGQGLVNLAAQRAVVRRRDLQVLTSAAFYGSIVVALILIAAAALTTGVTGPRDPFRLGIFVTIVCMAASLPLSVAGKLQTGFQKYESLYSFQIAGTLLAALLFTAVMRSRGGLLLAILSILLPPVLASIVNNIWLFAKVYPELKPRLALLSMAAMRRLLGTGMAPFIAQGCSCVIFVAPVWAIHAHLGAIAAGTYSALTRLLGVPTVFVSLATAPLWPIFARLTVGEGRSTAIRLVRNAFGAVAAFGLPIFALVTLASPYLLKLLTRTTYPASALTFLVGALCFLISLRQTLVMAVLGTSSSRRSTIAFVLGGLTGLLLPLFGSFHLKPAAIVTLFIVVETFLLGSSIYDLRLTFQRPASAVTPLYSCTSNV